MWAAGKSPLGWAVNVLLPALPPAVAENMPGGDASRLAPR